jgi:hypothetical protein
MNTHVGTVGLSLLVAAGIALAAASRVAQSDGKGGWYVEDPEDTRRAAADQAAAARLSTARVHANTRVVGEYAAGRVTLAAAADGLLRHNAGLTWWSSHLRQKYPAARDDRERAARFISERIAAELDGTAPETLARVRADLDAMTAGRGPVPTAAPPEAR